MSGGLLIGSIGGGRGRGRGSEHVGAEVVPRHFSAGGRFNRDAPAGRNRSLAAYPLVHYDFVNADCTRERGLAAKLGDRCGDS